MAFITRKTLIILSLLAVIGTGLSALSKNDPAQKAVSKPERALLSRVSTQLVSQRDGEIILEWECPDYQIERDPATGRIRSVDMAGAASEHQTGVPGLPKILQLLDCLPGRVAVQVLEMDVEPVALGNMAATPPDMPVDRRIEDDASGSTALDNAVPGESWTERSARTPFVPGWWPLEPVQTREAGTYRGHRLMSLQFYPVQVDAANGQARIIRRMKVRVTMPLAETASDRLQDRPEETELLRNMLGTLAPTAQTSRMRPAFEGRGAAENNLDDFDPLRPAWKLFVRRSGVVKLTAADLEFVGCPVDQITSHDTHIYNRGHEVPIYFSGEFDGQFNDGDYIEFWGTPNLGAYARYSEALYADRWADDNVYILTWGDGHAGLRLSNEDATYHTDWPNNTQRNVSNVKTLVHIERDYKYDRLAWSYLNYGDQLQTLGPLSIYQDHWFWGDRIDALSTVPFVVYLPFPDLRSLQPVRVRAAMQGVNWQSGPGTGHHRAVIYVNGHTAPGLSVGKVSLSDDLQEWVGQTAVIAQTDTSNSGILTRDLVAGNNTITVSLPGDGVSGVDDKIFANWFELEYDRALRASGGYIDFQFDTTRGDTFIYDVRGFNSRNIQCWKVGSSRLTNLSLRQVNPVDEGPSWSAKFQLISDGAYHIALFDEDQFPRPPQAIVPTMSTRNLRTLSGAQYLIIFHDAFANELALPHLLRLDSLRRVSFGGSVDTIRVSTIYEQFSNGIPDPTAIRDFLKYAYDNWQVRPTHVCLIGDGRLDTREFDGSGMISSLYPLTLQYGAAAADMLFGEVSGPPWDITPDIAVGRISCRTPQELGTYIDKLVTYEDPAQTAYNTLFHSTLLLVSDRRDANFNFDRNFSERTAMILPEAFNVNRVYLDSLRSGSGPSTLRDAFIDGALVVNYNGHGGGGVWSGTELINVSGVGLLQNAQSLPFITNFTCYVGAFDERSQSAVLGEAFLFSRNTSNEPVGGIGVYSSSGVGWALAGSDMQRVLFDFLLSPPARTLGEAVQTNKILYWGGRANSTIEFTNVYSMMMMMNLLGDPGVRLALPREQWADFSPDSFVVRHGQTVRVSGTLPWDPSPAGTEVYLLPYNGRFVTHEVLYGDTYTTVRENVAGFTFGQVYPAPPLYTRDFDSLTVTIPNRIISPQGHVIMYAVDQGSGGIPARDAIGSFTVYLEDSLINLRVSEVAPYPQNFIYSDSAFFIQARLALADGIESVRARGTFRPARGPVVLDTVNMAEVSEGLWRTPRLGPYDVRGGAYHIQFFVRPVGGGEEVESAIYPMTIELQPDYSVSTAAQGPVPEFRPGTVPYMWVPITQTRYLNTRPVQELTVRLTATHAEGGIMVDSVISEVTVDDPAGTQPNMFEVKLPAPLLPMSYQVQVRIDPQNLIPETGESNNQWPLGDPSTLLVPNLYPATNLQGSYLERLNPPERDFHRFWKSGTRDSIRLRLMPGSLSVDSTTLIYLGPISFSAGDQADIGFTGLFTPDSGQAMRYFRVLLADSSERLASGGRAQIAVTFSGVRDSVRARNLALYGKRSESPAWLKLRGQGFERFRRDTTIVPGGFRFTYSGRITAETDNLGSFGVFYAVDTRGPTINLSADGLHFTRHSLLPRRPQIFANLSDISGIDRSSGRFFMTLDGDTIPESMITWSDTLLSSGQQSALIRPDLDPGQHVIKVRATDNNGNTDSVTVDFEVRGSFDIDWAINYPNPFKKNTTISYLLTDVTDDFVQVKIFTVSGRLIRILREPDRQSANYREIPWDGRDDDGEEVGNGVYFAQIKARQGDKEVKKIIKMAKVR